MSELPTPEAYSSIGSGSSPLASKKTLGPPPPLYHPSSGGSDGGESSSVASSSYRHHSNGPFSINTNFTTGGTAAASGSDAAAAAAAAPQPVLIKDAHYKPKTTGSVGLLVVGLGGANGTTLLAGVLANRLRTEWHGPRGEPMSPNWYGCLTQLPCRRGAAAAGSGDTTVQNSSNGEGGGGGGGGGVGYKNKVRGLADASLAAVGGWVSLLASWFFVSLRRREPIDTGPSVLRD